MPTDKRKPGLYLRAVLCDAVVGIAADGKEKKCGSPLMWSGTGEPPTKCQKHSGAPLPRAGTKLVPVLRSPYWYGCWIEPVRDAEGRIVRKVGPDGALRVVTRQVHRSTKTSLLKLAERRLEEWRQPAQRAIEAPELADERQALERKRIAAAAALDARLTIEGMQALWLKHAGNKASVSDDRARFATLAAFLGPNTPIAELAADRVVELRDHLLASKNRTGRTNSRATVNRHLALLKSALKWAAANGHPHVDPMAKVRLLDEKNERDRLCTPAEFERLTEASAGELHLAIVVAYWTAMRLGEIVNLTWDRVDLKARFITLEGQHTKSGERRKIPLAAPVVDALKKWPRRIDGRVFTLKRGSISPAFSKLCKTLDPPILNLHVHDLRHTALTRLRREGADLFTLKAISGHATMEMLARYQHVGDDELLAAVDRVTKRGKRGGKT